MSFQNKVKFALWAYPETLKDVAVHYKNDNCKSQSEFIEKAIKFYIGYLDEEKSVNYISPMITETVKATIKVRNSGWLVCFSRSQLSLVSCRI